MNELKKTLSFAGIALILVVFAYFSMPRPATPDLLSEIGQVFFAEFTDPNEAASLEVIQYDEQTASAKPFKVVFKENLWVILSAYNYPADGKEQLAKTAAGMIGLKKEAFRSNNPEEYETFGVIDPMNETVSAGRGKRITIRNKNDQVLADIIVGKPLEQKTDLFYVREPEKKQVYVASLPFEISTSFEDWIETDLLQVEKSAISEINIQDYSINETSGTLSQRQQLTLSKQGDIWKLKDERKRTNTAKTTAVDKVLEALDNISIVGVRPKPRGLSKNLTASEKGLAISSEDIMSLQSKGYYLTRSGELVSNEGEMAFKTTEGVRCILRFGETLLDPGSSETQPRENRFLFITANFDPTVLPEPKKPTNLAFESKPDSLWSDLDKENNLLMRKHEQWKEKVEQGKKKARALNERFARWYYIIPSESFKTLDVSKRDLL
jgi:hypothetical protein